MWQEWKQIEVQTKLILAGPKGTDHPEDLGVDLKIILKWILRR